MTTGGSSNNKGEAKGFAGLSSLLSDVEEKVEKSAPLNENKADDYGSAVSTAPSESQEQEKSDGESNHTETPPDSRESSSSKEENANDTSQEQVELPPVYDSSPNYGSGCLKLIVFFGVLFVLAIILDDSSPNTSKPSAVPSPNYTNNESVASSSTSPTIKHSSSTADKRPAYPSSSSKLNRPVETKPEYGRNQVLGISKIRYCIAEDIRLDAAKRVIDNYVQSDVNKFNSLVDDYNNRCGEYRYRSGNLSRAERDIAPYRRQIEAEGKSYFEKRSSRVTTTSTPRAVASSSHPKVKFSATVKSIQQYLSDLGYKPGVADGFMGRKTSGAIRAYQKDKGIPIDGKFSSSLLSNLRYDLKLKKLDDANSQSKSSVSVTKPVTSQVNSRYSRSSDRGNYKTCISGLYPYSCKHEKLTRDEATLVDAAEKRENYKTCISGLYPYSCKHEKLTREEATLVDAAEKRENYKTCISGLYPYSCKHEKLTREQSLAVDAAEKRENYKICISGLYPYSCKHEKLTREQAASVRNAEKRAGN